jgi:hypothetical protein
MLLTSAAAYGGELKLEPDQQYLLLATTKTSTMQKEMDEAASLGFKVRVSSPTSGAEMVVLMEKVAKPPDLYQYRLLATTRTGTMSKELNEAGDQGFRLLPQTIIAKEGFIGGPEIVVLLEKAPGSGSTYQYKLLATQRTSTMQKEIREAEAAGFTLIGMCSRGEHIVIMEKKVE